MERNLKIDHARISEQVTLKITQVIKAQTKPFKMFIKIPEKLGPDALCIIAVI